MPVEAFQQHHILLNLLEEPQRVENWRNGQHRDFVFERDEIRFSMVRPSLRCIRVTAEGAPIVASIPPAIAAPGHPAVRGCQPNLRAVGLPEFREETAQRQEGCRE